MGLEEIIAEIKKGLTIDNDKNIEYLQEQMEKYAKSEYREEIYRECSKMIYDMLPKEETEEFQKAVENDLKSIYQKLGEANTLAIDGKYEEALKITTPLSNIADKIPFFKDDKRTEYYSFTELFEEILYKQIHKPEREVKRADFPFADIYYVHAKVLHGLNKFEEEENVLGKARKWNPVSSRIVVQYLENLKARGGLDDLYLIAKDVLMYTFRKKDLAAEYRNLGYYFFETKKYKEAVVAYVLSLRYDNDSDEAISELYYINQESGISAEQISEEDIIEVARNNDFAPGVSQKILQLAYGIGMQSADNNQKIAAKYFLSIVDGYVDDEDVKKKLKELEEK